jgi:hypothetical protein
LAWYRKAADQGKSGAIAAVKRLSSLSAAKTK